MTDTEAIHLIRKHVESLFPKECPNCHRRFANLREYVQGTQPVGATISYDAEAKDWQPNHPVGTTASANCACGTTLMLSSEGIPIRHMWRLLHWARAETRRRGVTPQQLLENIRAEIRRQVLTDPGPDPSGNGPG